MKPLLLLLFVGFLPLSVQAQAKPELALVTLKTAGEIPEADRKNFEAALRASAGGSSVVLDAGKTAQALKKEKISATCTTDTCGRAAARATGARFILHGTVSNSDEIYQVELQLFDSAFGRRSKETGDCELCSADEVKGTLKDVFARFSKALAVPPPKTVSEADTGYKLAVETTPPGAEVKVDGQVVGLSPVTASVTVGKHRVEISKAGFGKVEREVNALNATTSIKVSLDASAPGAVAQPEGGAADDTAMNSVAGDRNVAYGLTFGGA